jgi:DNA recombination protein RmuC
MLVAIAVTAVLVVVLSIRTKKAFEGAGREVRDELRMSREEARSAGRELREEVSAGLQFSNEVLSKTLQSMGNIQQTQLEGMTKQLKELAESNQGALDRIRDTLDSRVKELQGGNEKKLDEMRKTVEQKLHDTREEVSAGLKSSNEVLSKTLQSMGNIQQTQLEGMTKQLKELAESNQGALDRIRNTFDSRVKELQEGNEKKLDEMRKTVDEKLHDTLEKRLGESFKLVSERLEAVHQGLGEMQNLAMGVGDLKRVLVNVKARGTWAEVQLGAILEQILTPEQFERNVRVKPDSLESVEYAVRLPGPKDDPGACVWLPIDSKFPQED